MSSELTRLSRLNSNRLQDLLFAFTRSQLLFSAVELEVFTAIAQEYNTAQTLAHYKGWDTRATRIFLDGLVGIDLLHKTKQSAQLVYTLPRDVANYLVKTSPAYMGGMVEHTRRLAENWSSLTDVVRSGQPAGGAQGLATIEAFYAELVKGLYVTNYPAAQALADCLGIGSSHKGLSILDLAAGSGVWSIALLENDPKSQATLVDFATVTEVARPFITQHGLSDRVFFEPRDLEVDALPEGPPGGNLFDLVVMGHICHAIGPDATQGLLKKVFQVLKPGGRVAIVDFVPDNERAQAGWPLLFGVNMLVLTADGDVFTHAQYDDWARQAGFASSHCQMLEDLDVQLVLLSK